MTRCGMYFTSIRLWLNRSSFLSAIFIFVFLQEANGQVLQPDRFEYPLTPRENHFEIVPADTSGLFLQRVVLIHKSEQLQLIRLDTGFNAVWQGFIPIDKNYVVIGKRAFNNKLYVLLRYRDYTRNDFIMLVVDHDTGNYVRLFIKGYIPFAPTDFSVTDKAVLIGGYYNRVPLVLHFSMTGLRSKVLPGLFNESGELTQIKTYEDGTFDILISALNFQRQRTITIKSYDADGDLLRSFPLEAEPSKHLIFGRSLKTSNDVQIVAGVYGSRSTEFSRGIFIASIDQSGLQTIRYYNFGDLENFFKYMKAKREKRVKSRIERRKIKGKKIKFNYRFLVHELVPYKDQYVLLGEAFYPKYINIDRGYYNGFFTRYATSTSVIQNGRIFDGYYYTHAVVMGFKPNGDLLWDNSFEINDVRTFTLDQFVKIEVQPEKIALLYLYENQLRTKIIQDDEVLEGKSLDPIRTNYPNDIVRKNDSEVNKLEYWYNGYLFAYGIQEIENPTGGGKRRVFYINKVRHAP
jgi:hypothetical protein